MADTEATVDRLRATIRPNIRVTIDTRANGKDGVRVDAEVRHEHLR